MICIFITSRQNKSCTKIVKCSLISFLYDLFYLDFHPSIQAAGNPQESLESKRAGQNVKLPLFPPMSNGCP